MKFTSGLAVAALSGSEGGTTASRNKFGQYFRQKSQPVNPNTARQIAVRNVFSDLAFKWTNLLTQVQRDAWNLYGLSVVFKDSLGQDIFLTGFNHYVRTNTVGVGGAVARVDTGPTIFTLADTDPSIVATLSEATQILSLAFDDTLSYIDEDDALMQVQMTAPVGPGREFIGLRTRIAGYILGDSGVPLTSPQTFPVPFAVAENQKVIVQCRILRADGRLSDPFRDEADIAA